MSDEVRRLTLRRAGELEIQRAAVEGGMHTLYEDGIRKALKGGTSLEEVLRVTGET
jgi:general secretion pathway protein E